MFEVEWVLEGANFWRLRNPKMVQTASSANHSSHAAEGIKRRSTQVPATENKMTNSSNRHYAFLPPTSVVHSQISIPPSTSQYPLLMKIRV